MKCPYCASRPNMIKRTHDHDNWWECPECHRTVGKPEEKQEEEQKDED